MGQSGEIWANAGVEVGGAVPSYPWVLGTPSQGITESQLHSRSSRGVRARESFEVRLFPSTKVQIGGPRATWTCRCILFGLRGDCYNYYILEMVKPEMIPGHLASLFVEREPSGSTGSALLWSTRFFCTGDGLPGSLQNMAEPCSPMGWVSS